MLVWVFLEAKYTGRQEKSGTGPASTRNKPVASRESLIDGCYSCERYSHGVFPIPMQEIGTR